MQEKEYDTYLFCNPWLRLIINSNVHKFFHVVRLNSNLPALGSQETLARENHTGHPQKIN